MTTFKFFTYLPLALLLVFSCNSDKSTPVEELTEKEIELPEQAQAPANDTVRPAAGEDTVSIKTPLNKLPVKEPVQQRPSPTPQQQKKPAQQETPAPGTTATPTGIYLLKTVQGEEVPIVLDMTTECDVKLLSGELKLKDGNFHFESYTAEECAGQIGNREIQHATGTYRLEGDQLSLQVKTGQVLGDARGVLEGNKLRLQYISNDAEEQQVDWVFELK